MGHAAGVSFGAIGTPVLAQTALVDFSAADLARATAPYHVILGGILTAAVVLTIGRAFKGNRRLWTWAILAAILFPVPYALIATFVGPELPTLGGALAGVAIFAAVLARRRRLEMAAPLRRHLRGAGRTRGAADRGHPVPGPGCIGSGHLPHLPLREAVEGITVEWETGTGFSGSVRPLFHPAMLLTVAFAAGAVGQRASGRGLREAFLTATRQLGPVMVALMAMVTIARTMSHAGMTDELAFCGSRNRRGVAIGLTAVGAFGTFR